jgi:xylose isomerase
LKDKAARWNADPEIKALLAEIAETDSPSFMGKYSHDNAKQLLSQNFDRGALAAKGLQYEKLDQLTIDILFGVR